MKRRVVIIFDLDGTLIDSVPDLATSLNNTLKHFNKPTYHRNIIRNWVGNGAKVLVKRGLYGIKDTDDLPQPDNFDEIMEYFLNSYQSNLCKETILYPNVITTLQKLHKRGYILALATNKPARFLPKIIDYFGLNELFSVIVGGDDLPHKKPHPMPLLHICNSLGVDTANAIMVGDSKNDILSAKSANITSIAVTYGYNYDIPISQFDPDSIVDDFKEIDGIIKCIN